MRRYLLAIALCLVLPAVWAESVRGPVVARLEADPSGPDSVTLIGLDEIALIDAAGDIRFHDGLEIELTVPENAVEIPGALSLLLLTTGTIQERSGVSDVNGTPLLTDPLVRPGRFVVQVPVRADAVLPPGLTTTLVDRAVTNQERPILVMIRSLMKGTPRDVAEAEFELVARSVPREIGGVTVRFVQPDGSVFPTEGFLRPDFQLRIDGAVVEVASEYLLEPGIHRFELESEKYIDQSLTVGIERAQFANLEVPLLPAVATVNFSAPRGARVYIDGQSLDTANGVFTAQPGEHTMIVVIGDYTVTRRFSVEEGREYNVGIIMNLTVEETK